ncbi:MAG: hypothetical protein FWF06_08445 [Symbiobacteriaceae bacterium]|nr:hypothetical protein [Symbiobacteriaceae bacterium]
MSLRIARWCAIYSLGVAIAMGAINLIHGGQDWGFIIISTGISGGVLYYLDYVIAPQMQKKLQEEAEQEAALRGESSEAAPRRRKRPRLKKQS